ncbi:hypothetical protein G7Z17_g11154 [Cylindrodendrum hubeiense]|uniref:Uncharacterized protein n=1 Tax=Cylindrodendrum hubeiense TaxID=595255 RepID=A0A9P5LAH9_9HYPO|nr:hypothetical protein G7Z17_g11154 [Cylindrodendrum hubeiense]
MPPLQSLPTRLVTCIPPWCPQQDSGPATSHSPEPFHLRFRHIPNQETSIWDALHDMAELNDHTLQGRILLISREIESAYHEDGEQVHGMPVALARKFGETSLRDADNLEAAKPTPWPFMTDVLARDHNDRKVRAAQEYHVLKALYEEVSQPYPELMPTHKHAALGESPLLAIRRCRETVRTFHDMHREDGVREGRKKRQAFVLWHVAARAAEAGAGWETRREGSLQSVLAEYCDDILKMRERVGGDQGNYMGLGL